MSHTHSAFGIMPGLAVIALLYVALAHSQNTASPDGRSFESVRTPDTLSTFSGRGTMLRMSDSAFYCYGQFRVISRSAQTEIAAHRLKREGSNGFENDFLSGRVYLEGVDVHTNRLFLGDIIRFSADHITYSRDSSMVCLEGHASVHGDDVKILSGSITLLLEGYPSPR